jgi:divalent metal cation (Fe/Co/Zn/Cd) transporter
VFVTGGVLSIAEGVRSLRGEPTVGSYRVAYVVLAVALVFESISLWRVHRQLRREADELDRELLTHVVQTSDPVTRAVFAEDIAAVIGNVIALIGVGLHQLTGSAVPDGVAAIAIGVLLTVVAVFLAARNREFLVGEQAPEPLRARLGDELAAVDGIDAVNDLVVTFVGPRRVRVLAEVDVDDRLTGAQVEELVRRAEDALRGVNEIVARVDVVPRGRAQVAGGTPRGDPSPK